MHPKEQRVGFKYVNKFIGNESRTVIEEIYQVFIPLKHSLKSFLEIPGIYESINHYIQTLKNDLSKSQVISNITQANLWQRKYAKIKLDGLFLPLLLYYDDFEGRNPLGSRAGVNKFGTLYATIACLPSEISSKLSSILFASLICSNDAKHCSLHNRFSRIIMELNHLRTVGLLLNIDGIPKKVYIQCVAVLGDNLGSNEIRGMTTSFNNTPFCRICKAQSQEGKKMIQENISLLRNVDNYKKDLCQNEVSETGVKQGCVFNEIIGYEFTEHQVLDPMHDVLEGVGKYVMRSIIFDFMFRKTPCFNLEKLYQGLQGLNYGQYESNEPPIIQMHSEKNKINLNGLQLKCYA